MSLSVYVHGDKLSILPAFCDLLIRLTVFIDRKAREIMYLVASVRPQRSRSNFWRVAVDLRGSALPSAAKRSHYQSKVFVCVSNNRADAVDRL